MVSNAVLGFGDIIWKERLVFLKNMFFFLLVGIWSSPSKSYGFNVQNFGEK